MQVCVQQNKPISFTRFKSTGNNQLDLPTSKPAKITPWKTNEILVAIQSKTFDLQLIFFQHISQSDKIS